MPVDRVESRRQWPALELTHRSGQPIDDDLDARLHAWLDDYSPTAIEDVRPSTRRVFFESPVHRDRASVALRASDELADLRVESVDVPDDGWAERSQAALRAVTIERVVIAPPWDCPPAADDRHVVIIEPSMGFGTGHHASTRLMIKALQALDVRGARVLDLGTGSGVLAIVAAKLGASEVLGIDSDSDALDCAQQNVSLNETADIVKLALSDLMALDVRLRSDDHHELRRDFVAPANIVLANLTADLLVRACLPLQRLVAQDGYLVVSGILLEQEEAVTTALSTFCRVGRFEEDGWVGLTLRNRLASHGDAACVTRSRLERGDSEANRLASRGDAACMRRSRLERGDSETNSL